MGKYSSGHHIILSPHFDDAVLSLGGLLAKNGMQSSVITCFTGIPLKIKTTDWDTQSGFDNSIDAMSARAKENDAGLSLLGVAKHNIINLQHDDSQYRTRHSSRTARIKIRNALIDSLITLLNRYKEAEITVYAPIFETHADHRLIKQILIDTISRIRTPSVRYCFYRDIPYTYLDVQKKSLKKTVAIGGFRACAVSIPLTQADVSKKLQAVALYASQIYPLENAFGIKLPPYIKKFASTEAGAMGTAAPFCEVVYNIMCRK